jgi:hypothetical protein
MNTTIWLTADYSREWRRPRVYAPPAAGPRIRGPPSFTLAAGGEVIPCRPLYCTHVWIIPAGKARPARKWLYGPLPFHHDARQLHPVRRHEGHRAVGHTGVLLLLAPDEGVPADRRFLAVDRTYVALSTNESCAALL